MSGRICFGRMCLSVRLYVLCMHMWICVRIKVNLNLELQEKYHKFNYP